MSRIVPVRRVGVPFQHIRNGVAVRGSTWTPMGETANWLTGRGCQLVPAWCPALELPANDTLTFRFRAPRSNAALEREWQFRVQETAAWAAGEAPEFRAPGGSGSGGVVQTLRETVASPAGGVGEVSFDVSTPTTGTARLDLVACVEVPRVIVEATEEGVELAALEPGDPMLGGAEIARIVSVARTSTHGRRTLAQWARPVEDPLTTTSTSFADVWSLGVPVLGRSLGGVTETTRSVTVDALAWVTGGGGAEIRATSSSTSDTDTVSVSATTATWVSATVDVDAEDVSTADGRRGSATDLLTVEYRATSGTLSLASVSVYES